MKVSMFLPWAISGKLTVFFILFLLLGTNPAKAQLNIHLGKEVENDTRFQLPYMIGTIDDNVFTYRQNVKILGKDWNSLERYNSKLEQTLNAEVISELYEKPAVFVDFRVMEEKPVLFCSYMDAKMKQNKLYTIDYNPQSLKAESEPKPLMDIPILNMRNRGEFHLTPSPNHLLFMILAEIAGAGKEPAKLKLKVITASKTTMWENDIRLPVTNRLFEEKQWVVDNSGKAYLVGKLYFDKVKEAVKGEPNFEYLIYAWEAGNPTPKEYHLSFPDKFITDFKFGIDPGGNMVGTGLWSEKGVYSVKGCFFLAVDALTGAIQAKSISEFEPGFMSLFLTEKQVKKGKELYEYELRDIIFFEDGSASLLAEQYYVVVVTTYTYGPNNTRTSYTTYYYYYNDIFCIHFDAMGQIEWKCRIPKYQVTTNDGGFYSSFAAAQHGKELLLVYNDHPDNLDVKEKERLKNYVGKESCTVAVTIHPNGEWNKEILFEKKAEDVYCLPKVIRQFNPDEDLFIYGQRGKLYRLGKISF